MSVLCFTFKILLYVQKDSLLRELLSERVYVDVLCTLAAFCAHRRRNSDCLPCRAAMLEVLGKVVDYSFEVWYNDGRIRYYEKSDFQFPDSVISIETRLPADLTVYK